MCKLNTSEANYKASTSTYKDTQQKIKKKKIQNEPVHVIIRFNSYLFAY
jgi:hypothetical protein